MQKKSGLGWYLGAAAAVALGLFTSAAAADTVKIGAVLSVTGPASFLGDPEKKVLDHYVAKLNAAGGIKQHLLCELTHEFRACGKLAALY